MTPSVSARFASAACALAIAWGCGSDRDGSSLHSVPGGEGGEAGAIASPHSDGGDPHAGGASDGGAPAGSGGLAGSSPAERGEGGAAGAEAPGTSGAGGEAGGTSWSAFIGRWCASADGDSHWIVLDRAPADCASRAEHLFEPSSGDGVAFELATGNLEPTSAEHSVAVRVCRQAVCEVALGSVAFDSWEPEQAARGRVQAELVDGTWFEAAFEATWCDWDQALAANRDVAPPVRDLRLSAVSAFQAVEVPLMEVGEEPRDRRVSVVAGRAALLRAYVAPEPEWRPRSVRATLRVDTGGARPHVLEQVIDVHGFSNDRDFGSAFNFDLPAEWVDEGTSYSVELSENSACGRLLEEPALHRYPASGMVELPAVPVGGVRLELIPIRYRNGSSVFEPDVSPDQVARFRERLLAVFPITHAEISVRPEVIETQTTELELILDEVAALRDEDAPPDDVTYYGLVQFTDTFAEHCDGACVAGASVVGESPRGGTAVGLGYPGPEAVHTLAHELGHVYGRVHSPCGVQGDPEYPYSGGLIGSWGYDAGARLLIDPNAHADFMGYCSPSWVSDYVYGELQRFIGALNRAALYEHRKTARSARSPGRAVCESRPDRPSNGRSPSP